MPRLPPSLLRQASNIAPHLPLILRGARLPLLNSRIPIQESLQSALNELRWLREHVALSCKSKSADRKEILLRRLCVRRSRAEPLQYILGSQPFGELEIGCRRGVLIPRPETEDYTTYLASLLSDNDRDESSPDIQITPARTTPLRILDLCTGSGCIPLLLHHLLTPHYPKLDITAVDISPMALSLSRQNLQRNLEKGILDVAAKHQVCFQHADVFDDIKAMVGKADVIVSNPPYISEKAFRTETTRSVQRWEPRLALVPVGFGTNASDRVQSLMKNECEGKESLIADRFYQRILSLFRAGQAKVLLMEVGDKAQAWRVVAIAEELLRGIEVIVEVWRDYPGARERGDVGSGKRFDRGVFVRGVGSVRSVFIRRVTNAKKPDA